MNADREEGCRDTGGKRCRKALPSSKDQRITPRARKFMPGNEE